jgi:hypothetical protein
MTSNSPFFNAFALSALRCACTGLKFRSLGILDVPSKGEWGVQLVVVVLVGDMKARGEVQMKAIQD